MSTGDDGQWTCRCLCRPTAWTSVTSSRFWHVLEVQQRIAMCGCHFAVLAIFCADILGVGDHSHCIIILWQVSPSGWKDLLLWWSKHLSWKRIFQQANWPYLHVRYTKCDYCNCYCYSHGCLSFQTWMAVPISKDVNSVPNGSVWEVEICRNLKSPTFFRSRIESFQPLGTPHNLTITMDSDAEQQYYSVMTVMSQPYCALISRILCSKSGIALYNQLYRAVVADYKNAFVE